MVDVNAPYADGVQVGRNRVGGMLGRMLSRILPSDIEQRVEQLRQDVAVPEVPAADTNIWSPDLTYRGAEQWQTELSLSGHKPGTPQFDQWVRTLQTRPDDPEYNRILQEQQFSASQREQLRERMQQRQQAEPKRAGTAQIGGYIGLSKVVEQVAEQRPSIIMLGPDGQPLPEQFRINRDGSIEGFAQDIDPETRGMLDAIDDPQTRAVLEQQLGAGVVSAGEYLWMGDMASGPGGEPVDSFMTAEHAVNLPYYWSMDQVMFAQEAFGMDASGFVDERFMNAWRSLVGTSAGYTMAGRNVSPFLLLDMMHDAEQARSAGGGGAGSRGRAYSRSETTGLLHRVMTDEAGREATPDEAMAFHAAINGAGIDIDPMQFAVEWVRSQVGAEAGAFQVATDYYSAMMQVLGSAGSEAVRPVG